jgi:hypothetical protein
LDGVALRLVDKASAKGPEVDCKTDEVDVVDTGGGDGTSPVDEG